VNRLENRIPPPVLTLLVGVGMWAAAPGPVRFVGGRALAAALAFVCAGALGLPALRSFRRAGTTIDPIHVDRAGHLVTEGIYRITRNPMYVALASLVVAWACLLPGLRVWAGPAFLVFWLDRFQIVPEERALTARFGEAYVRYGERVRRWL